MRGDASAYAALGLEPGADAGSIDLAYKRLIRRYHPDRKGGDSSRAAEINRAYRELRGRSALSDPLILPEEEPEGAGNGWVRAAIVLIAALAVLLLATGPVTALIRKLTPKEAQPMFGTVPSAGSADSMDRPIHTALVEEAVHDAMRIAAHGDGALLSASRDCQRALSLQPSMMQLDRCAAFDDAVVQLQAHDPTGDGGRFSELAVSRRQFDAASTLSNDYLAVDSRLDRIRLQVELALAAPERPETGNVAD